MKALFLTAGLATRFRPHTNKVPKPLLPFFGIPLYLYCYELLKTIGVNNYVFNLHHLPETLETGVNKYAEAGYKVQFSDETAAILGSGGAIKKAASILSPNEDFILQNGDEVFFPYDNELQNALKLHSSEERLSTIIVMDHPEAGKKFGAVWVDDKGKVLGFGKQAIAGGKPKHYIGTMILNARIIQHIPLKEINILYDTLLPLLQHEPVYAHTINCTWFETGNEKDYIDAHKEVLANLKEVSKSNHFQMMLDKYLKIKPADLSKSPMIFKQGKVDVSPSAKLEGFVWLQDGAKVKAGAKITNSVVAVGANIDADAVISNQLVLE